MASSAKLALFAFLRNMRSISVGRNLKAFILRCVLLWPRILRSLRKVWSWYFQNSAGGGKETKKDTGGPSPLGTTRKREECVVVCASQAFGGVGEPSRHSVLRSSEAEQSIQLENGIPRNSSIPHPLSSSYAPAPQDPPWPSATTPPSGSPHTSVRSFRTESSVGSVNSRSNAPVPWSHSRATAGQFTGVSSRSRSRPSSPFRHRSTRPDLVISTPPDMTQDTQGPLSPSLDGLTQSFPTNHWHPSTESVNASEVSSDLRGHSPSMSGAWSGGHMGAPDSKDSERAIQDPLTSQPTQAPRITFPEPSISRISESIIFPNDVIRQTSAVATVVRPIPMFSGRRAPQYLNTGM